MTRQPVSFPLNSPAVGSVAFDRDLRFVDVDEWFSTHFHLAAAQVVGRTLGEALPQLAPTLEPLLRQVARTGQPAAPALLPSDTGAPGLGGWFACCTPVRTRAGTVLGVEVTLHPSPAPAAAAPLAPRPEYDQAIFDQAPIGVLIADATGRLIDVNPALCQITGYERDELLRLTPDAPATPGDLADAQALVGRIFAGNQATAVSIERYRRKDEALIWVQVTRSLVGGQGGAAHYGLAFVEDITAQILATQSLRHSEATFAAAFNYGPVILTITRLADGRLTLVNERFLITTGYTRDEVLGRTPLELGLWADPRRRAIGLDHLTQGNPPVEGEADFRMKDGSVRTCLLFATLIEVGDERSVLTALTDITERRRAEAERARLAAELAHERGLLAAVLHQLPAGVMIATPQSRAALSNLRAAQIFGIPFVDGLLPSPEGYRGYFPDGRPYAIHDWPLTRATAQGEVVQGEQIVIERGDGARTVIEVNAAPVRDDAGAIIAGVSAFADIGDRVRAVERQQLLADIGAVLTTTLDITATIRAVADLLIRTFADTCSVVLYETGTLPAHVLVAHADPTLSARLEALGRGQLRKSAAMEGLLRGLLGERPSLLEQDLSAERLAALPLAAGDRALVAVMAPRSGLLIRFSVRGRAIGVFALTRSDPRRPFDEDDLALAEDIAHRCALALENARLYADEQRARGEAERSVRLRDEFLSVASHELKSPLTALLGNVQLVQRRAQRAGLLAEGDRARLEAVVGQVQRLSQMIDQLLDVTQIAAQHITLRRAPLDLAAVVRQVIADLRPALGQHQLALDLPDAPAPLVGDELRLAQVVTNLVQNAIKYSPPGRKIAITLRAEPDTVALTVADQGIGIPPAALPRLFERYYRASNVGGTQAAGLGIGLYVVKEVVELHGGAVLVDSAEGQGSRFTVTVPRHGEAL